MINVTPSTSDSQSLYSEPKASCSTTHIDIGSNQSSHKIENKGTHKTILPENGGLSHDLTKAQINTKDEPTPPLKTQVSFKTPKATYQKIEQRDIKDSWSTRIILWCLTPFIFIWVVFSMILELYIERNTSNKLNHSNSIENKKQA